MADTINPNLSIALYHYMCQHIVGTEDHVKQIRTMNAVRDNIASGNDITIITSGSFGEGLEMRGSDLDIMMVVHKLCEVCEDIKIRLNPKMSHFIIERDDVKPCYALLRINHYIYPEVLNYCEEHNGKQYYSSALHKQRLVSDLCQTIHGPCISNKKGDIDFAICLHCKTWISPALQWITRSSNSWPSNNVKQSIIKHGVLLVPVGVKGSHKEDKEWRVSFSVGEKLLINTFTHTQLLCYALLKILLKDIITKYSECKDLLCSYFLKTIIFWISEEVPQSVWKPDNIIPCFMRCFSRLVYCVEHSVCLHYFIPENNMFENKIEGRPREILLKKLYTLYSYGWRSILFSDQISKFRVSIWNFHIEKHTLYVDDVKKMLDSRFLMHANSQYATRSRDTESKLKKAILQTVFCQQSSIKDVYKYYMSMCSRGLAQNISQDSTHSNNKYKYKQYKSCLSTLLQNVYHDVVSGWLMVASLFYKTKQYSKALCVIKYSISKCTPEKLSHFMTMTDYQSIKLNLFRKKSFVFLEKIMRVDGIRFKENSFLVPDELQIVHSKSNYILWFPCTVYAYFLEFLCHYHLKNVRQVQHSLQRLRLVIDDNFLMPQSDWFKLGPYTLLAIALKLLIHKKST